jgi:hypothetical protein
VSLSRPTPSSFLFATLNTTCCSGHLQLHSLRSRSRKPLRTRLPPVWNMSMEGLSVRDHMVSTKATEGQSRTKVLQEVQTVLVVIHPKLLLITTYCSRCFPRIKTNHPCSPPPPAFGTHSSRLCTTNGTPSWTPVIPLDGSIIRRSVKILCLRGRTGGLKCYVPVTCSKYVLTFAFLKLAFSKLFNLVRWTVHCQKDQSLKSELTKNGGKTSVIG